MLKIDIVTAYPQPAPGGLTALLVPPSGKPFATKATAEGHPGWEDYRRRAELAALTSPYLTSSSPSLLALPLGAQKSGFVPEKIKTLAAQAYWTAKERRDGSLLFPLDAPRGAESAADVVEGLALAAYVFNKYKRKDEANPEPPEPTVVLVVASNLRARTEKAVAARLKLCQSVNRARDLINEPASVATPAEIESRAREVAGHPDISIEVLDHKRLAKEGYEGLLTVGKGGNVPPRMIVLRYNPRGAASSVNLGLLGKGITFDTGGVSIKSSANMWQMKGDMSGAAAVLYALEAIATARVKLRVTAIIVTAQNYVDANSAVPGDLIRARNGKTIHIDNTDAEGRLILTDGLWRAGEEKVTHLVDVATLTGAILHALGNSISGAFGNDRFVDRVVRVAEQSGELCWKLPLHAPYLELLKHDVADINNRSTTPLAGSILAGLFLQEFLPEGISWTHLDIAGTFLQEGKANYRGPGATGVMVRTLAGLAESMVTKKKR
jgi:leucyl aminopeptidase